MREVVVGVVVRKTKFSRSRDSVALSDDDEREAQEADTVGCTYVTIRVREFQFQRLKRLYSVAGRSKNYSRQYEEERGAVSPKFKQ